MSANCFNLTELTAAASARKCMVHLHRDDKGRNVFSVGNSEMGATEFLDYAEALDALRDEGLSEEDCAERAGAALAENALNDIRNAPSQAVSMAALQTALLDLQRLPHPVRAAGGFAVALVAFVERGVHK